MAIGLLTLPLPTHQANNMSRYYKNIDMSIYTKREQAILFPKHEDYQKPVFASRISQAIANHYGRIIPTLIVFDVAGG